MPVYLEKNIYDINCPVVDWNGHLLPEWLFYIPKIKDTFISPAAQFKPVAALSGSPWQTTTTPKQQKLAKTLIIDTHFYINGLQEQDLIAQIEWFKLQEITVYLCIERDGLKSLVSCNEPNQNFEAYIEFLGQFDETTDYEQLTASNNLVRDTTAVLNVERSQQMFACMNQQKRHIVSNHRGSDDGSATSTPEYRFYDESAYAIHIPYAILAQNKAMKAADYPICLNPPADCADGNDLIHLITQYPYLTHKLLEQNKDLITHELVSAFYHKLPELRAVIIPYCYDLIGQSPIIDIDYYILLKDKLDLHQIPLEHFKLNYSLFKWACPNLEERFDALLHTGFNAKSLLKVFPHRAHEIFSHFPPKDLYDLKDYITAVPEDADSIIQSHQSLLVNATNSKFFLIQIRYFWTVFKNAKTTKALLNDLIQPHLDSMDIIVDYLACEPPEVEAFLKKNNLFTGLSKHFIISLANKNPQMAAYLFKYLNTPLTFIDLECVTNKDLKLSLYERYQPQVSSIKDLIILLSLYPEQFDRLIDEYQFLLENSGSFRVDHLPPKLALTLIQLFPDKAQINEVNTPSINPLWQKPPFINHILNQISRKNIDINSLISYYDQLAFLGRDLAEQIIAEQILISTEKFSLPALDSRKTKGDIILFETSPIIEIMAQVTYSSMQMLVYTPSFSHPEHPPQYNECTALTIGMLEDALEVDLRKFPNLISLKINLCTASPFKIQQFFDELNQYCPKLTHLSAPESLAPKSCHLPYKINYQKEKKLKESITSSINMVNTIMREIKAYSLQDGASSSHDLPPVDKQAINLFQRTDNSTAKSSSSIFVANNTLSHSTLSPNTSHSFIMVKTGELLNGQGKEPHRLRTGIIELNDDLSRQHTQIPEFILRPLPQKLTPELINVCRLGDDGFYYLLTLKTSANQTVRLLSADAQEELIALDSQGVETKLMRGSDDFYYVLLDKECTLSYVIKAPEPQKSLRSYRHLKADDPIKEILDRYLNLPNYTPESTRFESKRVCETFPEWFERLYTIGQGSCQERCCAVWFQIAKNPIIKDRARLVDIENNHVRLEIKDLEGRWIQVDLGGIRANHCYDNRNSYKAHTLSSAQDIQNRHALNKNHIPNVQASSSSSTSCAPSQSHFYEQKEKWNCIETFVQLETLISNHQIPKIVSHLDQVFDYEQFPVLLIHQNREVCAQQFLHQAKLHNRPVFFLHDPNQVKVGKEQIHLESDSPTISTEDALDLFKKRNRGNPDATILIDWAAFSPQQRVALNSIIDKKHSLYNKKLKFKIYSLCSELPKDSSFVSRHPHLIKPLLPIPAVHTLQAARQCTIDLKGLGDWQETLFGPIILNNNQLEWQKSEFVLTLEENDPQPLLMILSNIPTHARKELNTLLQRAKAQGYLEYHHAQIPLTEQVQFKLDCTEFNVTKFQPVHLIKNIESSQLPPDFRSSIPNSLIFY
ncbi:hypothetical protein ELY21_11825 [Legionella sp. km535]|uniref:hypothetical protein n=1 Tax=Legionella sp. km535 TaxID=2498107 RepID=UPI000F8F13E1|nr:hypothetical protein [Legionella sp. km535]RUR16938.1 hypothetical protein ELY21_11825 [Legionella sp. km535]